jgi:hypothetical protein
LPDDLRFALPLAAPLLDAGLRDVSLTREIADLVVMNTFKMGARSGESCKVGCQLGQQLFALVEQGLDLVVN